MKFQMRLSLCVALFVLPFAAVKAFPQGQPLADDLEKVRVQYGLPAIAAAVVKNGTIVASGVAGVRVHGTTIPATIDDRFHLGSDTKAMTASLAGMLVDEGKLKWTSTIGDVLGADVPGINPELAAVTLEQLLSHTGGIPSDNAEIVKLYYSSDAFQYNLRALRLRILAALKDRAPETKPGTKFHYANLGYMIAGAMMEKSTGEPWELLIRKRIFEPLGLQTAGLGPQATTGKFDAPVGHQMGDDGKIMPMPWGDAADVPQVIGPAGSAHMSVLDFAKWAAWNAAEGRRGPYILKPETLTDLHRPRVRTGPLPGAKSGTPQEGEYALGWGVIKFDWTPKPVLEHNGSNSMNFAKILVDANQDLGVVVVSNFAPERSEKPTKEVMEMLYRRFSRPATE